MITIEVYADFICPWCYIGHLRLMRTLRTIETKNEIEIKHMPFQLYPEIPSEGSAKEIFSKKTKPGMGKALKRESQIEKVHLNYSKITTIPNSFEAHRLVFLSRDEDEKHRLVNHLFKGYFEDGTNIGLPSELAKIALESSLSKQTIELFSDPESGKEETLSTINRNTEKGISIVPTFRMNELIVIPGLQEEETYNSYILRMDRKF